MFILHEKLLLAYKTWIFAHSQTIHTHACMSAHGHTHAKIVGKSNFKNQDCSSHWPVHTCFSKQFLIFWCPLHICSYVCVETAVTYTAIDLHD